MATDIVIPQLGESISEAVIASWLKAEGEYVEVDEEIVELETDKVTMPLPSTAAGVLKHGAEEGDTVAVGAVIASVDESAAKPEKAAVAEASAPASSEPAPKEDAPAPAASSAPASDSGSARTATAVCTRIRCSEPDAWRPHEPSPRCAPTSVRTRRPCSASSSGPSSTPFRDASRSAAWAAQVISGSSRRHRRR